MQIVLGNIYDKIIEDLKDYMQKYAEKSNNTQDFSVAVKTRHSNNITLEDWNSLLEYVSNLNSDSNTGDEFLLELSETISQIVNALQKMETTLIIIRDNVSPNTTLEAREIQFNGDVWKFPYTYVDSQMSETSTNPVQNNVVTSYIKQQTKVDTEMSGSSSRPVANKIVKAYIDDNDALISSNSKKYTDEVKSYLLSYADAVESTLKTYTNNKVTRANLISTIGEATSTMSGIMSVADKKAIETLKSMLVDGDTSIVDTIYEIIEVFAKYPEGTDLFTLLSEKANKKDVYTKEETDTMAEALVSIITIGYTEV